MIDYHDCEERTGKRCRLTPEVCTHRSCLANKRTPGTGEQTEAEKQSQCVCMVPVSQVCFAMGGLSVELPSVCPHPLPHLSVLNLGHTRDRTTQEWSQPLNGSPGGDEGITVLGGWRGEKGRRVSGGGQGRGKPSSAAEPPPKRTAPTGSTHE